MNDASLVTCDCSFFSHTVKKRLDQSSDLLMGIAMARVTVLIVSEHGNTSCPETRKAQIFKEISSCLSPLC